MLIRKSIVLILASFLFLACSTDQTNSKTMKQPQSYLALGDSYTIGQGMTNEDRFPVILSKLLNEKDLLFDAPLIIARTGWTTDELSAAIEQENIQKTFDLVTLLIGVNNQYRGRSAEEYETEFADLLATALLFANSQTKKVVVVSIPDWGQTPFAEGRDREQIAREIDAYNAAAGQICQAAGITFVNITPFTRQLVSEASYLAPDGLHYSGKMHQKWAEEIISQLDISIYENIL